MANSASHRLGQIIGDFLEDLLTPLLEEFCSLHRNDDPSKSLYLDKKGHRRARSGMKLEWHDKYGNAHDLDFVIERGGTDERIGLPVAFIEVAWRRYTKHSRNKAQEIQAAVIPIAEKYEWSSPFKGAFLAGCFTEPAINQMISVGFEVSMFSYESIVSAFSRVNVNISFGEKTSDSQIEEIIKDIESLDDSQLNVVKEKLLELNSKEIDKFLSKLDIELNKKIEKIQITPLHGKVYEFKAIDETASFIQNYEENIVNMPLIKFEVYLKYSTGNEIKIQFKHKNEINVFLEYISKCVA